jgi:hypothetical protein
MSARARIRYRVHVLPWLRGPGSRLLLPGWLAITLGGRILTWRPLDPVELAHELEHVRQWHRHGPLFVVRYLAASLASWRAGTGWYRGNRFEVAARAAADRVAREAPSPGSVPARGALAGGAAGADPAEGSAGEQAPAG